MGREHERFFLGFIIGMIIGSFFGDWPIMLLFGFTAGAIGAAKKFLSLSYKHWKALYTTLNLILDYMPQSLSLVTNFVNSQVAQAWLVGSTRSIFHDASTIKYGFCMWEKGMKL